MRGGSLENHIRVLLNEGYYWRDKPWPIICRVPNDMHNNRVVDNPQAYKPELVSIGPFHYQNESLLPMLQHKLRLYIRLSERLYGSSTAIENDLKKTVDALVQRARQCYSESFHTITDSDFSWMLTLDTCFILEGIVVDDPIFNARRMLPALRLDLIKMENQLPFFLLEELYAVIRTTDQDEPPSLIEYACKFFAPLVLQSANKMYTNAAPVLGSSSHTHLLALVHSMFKPRSPRGHAVSSPTPTSISIRESDQLMDMSKLRCASDLLKFEIKFSIGDGCLLDIDYRVQSPRLEIPYIVINHSTISVFRNLLAYEQLYDRRESSYFTPYIMFLAQLVKTQKDVEMLRDRGIMNHTLVSDDQVVMEIGNLYKEAAFAYDPLDCYLRMPIKFIINLQNDMRKRWMIRLKEDYFSTPGDVMSYIFAIEGIVLSVIQTFYTVYTAKQNSLHWRITSTIGDEMEEDKSTRSYAAMYRCTSSKKNNLQH
ncbi:hypothetical protein LguiA_026460 [Lonicera macranthoides]